MQLTPSVASGNFHHCGCKQWFPVYPTLAPYFFVNKDKFFDSLDANASAGDGGADAKSAGSFLDFQWASLKVKTKYQAKKSDFEKHFKQLQDLVGIAKVDIDVATWNVFSKDEQNKIYFLEYADYASCGCVCLFFA